MIKILTIIKNYYFIWGIFACMFLLLAITYFIISFQKIDAITVLDENTIRDLSNFGFSSGNTKETLSTLFLNVQNNLNLYIKTINQSNKISNLISSGGYFAAFLTSIASAFVSKKL